MELPTGTRAFNRGNARRRTVPAGEAPPLRIEFRRDPSGTIAYTLRLDFNDGTSSTLTFSIAW